MVLNLPIDTVRMLIFAIVMGAGVAYATGTQVTSDTLAQELGKAWRACDGLAIAELQPRILEHAAALAGDYDAQALAAESYLFRADLARNARKIGWRGPKPRDFGRDFQERCGKSGLPYAEAALRLADTAARQAQAECLLGELLAHQISGPISGMSLGPKALEHVTRALELAPEDSECERARGLMFLYNPPFSGGDAQEAIACFKRCLAHAGAQGAPEGVNEGVKDEEPAVRRDIYGVHLAEACRKAGRRDAARAAALEALEANPENPYAAKLVTDLRLD